MNKKTKVLVVGRDVIYGKLPKYKKGFEHHGCNVEIINKDSYKIKFWNRALNWILRKLIPISKKISVQHYYGVENLNNKLLEKVNHFKPDFVFFIKPIKIKPETIKIIKNKKIKTFAWSPDYLFNPTSTSIKFHKSLPFYDCIFTPRSFNIKKILNKGARKVVFLPFSVDISYHHPIKVSGEEKEKWGADVVFVGNCHEKYRAIKMNKLCKLGYDVKVYGSYWNESKWTSCLREKGCVNDPTYGEDFNKVMSSSKIAIGFLAKQNRDLQTSRTYEVPATGIFMLHERTDEATNLYEEGKEVEFFDVNDFEEIREKIDYYLDHSDEREKIAKAGYKKATSYPFSYTARAEKVLKIYNKIKNEI